MKLTRHQITALAKLLTREAEKSNDRPDFRNDPRVILQAQTDFAIYEMLSDTAKDYLDCDLATLIRYHADHADNLHEQPEKRVKNFSVVVDEITLVAMTCETIDQIKAKVTAFELP